MIGSPHFLLNDFCSSFNNNSLRILPERPIPVTNTVSNPDDVHNSRVVVFLESRNSSKNKQPSTARYRHYMSCRTNNVEV